MTGRQRTNELGEFLRVRRDLTDPASVGLTARARRRVPGLRREEVASLARVSPDYYTRIEQGRVNPSIDVLDAVAAALALEPDAHRHLRALASPWPADLSTSPGITGGMARLIDLLGDSMIAHVVGPRLEVLAYNRLAEELIFPFSSLAPAQRNLARIHFLEPAYRVVARPQWNTTAEQLVGLLRASFARAPDDPYLVSLTEALSDGSPQFAELWDEHHTRRRATGKRTFEHPAAGRFALDMDSMQLAEDSDLLLVTFSAAPGSTAAAALATVAGQFDGGRMLPERP